MGRFTELLDGCARFHLHHVGIQTCGPLSNEDETSLRGEFQERLPSASRALTHATLVKNSYTLVGSSRDLVEPRSARWASKAAYRNDEACHGK
jgi:hypothetical protein